MIRINIIPKEEFHRVGQAQIDAYARLEVIANMCRLNTLSSVKLAGSGHLGSSFSSLDIVVMLYYSEMNTVRLGVKHPDRDIYFSSKGHDVPGLYSVFYSLNILPEDKFLKLRRLGGTFGHPDVVNPGIEANSGSLGQGISKAKGMSLAKSLGKREGRVFVMTGDGEFQEGQIWESLQTSAHQKITNITVIVDHNKIQSDKPVKDIIDLGDLENKLKVFGWHVERCDGHNFAELDRIFTKFRSIKDKPKALIADTIKGSGVSFMEGPRALIDGSGFYKWHSGAPDDESYERGFAELHSKVDAQLKRMGLKPLSMRLVEERESRKVKLKDTAEKVVEAYGQALVEIGEKRSDVVVLDADLSSDCGLRPFEFRFPERFIENGIAEQDMVSMAGGLALMGFLPIVNSFGAFLASRANEQIYTNCAEGTKIIYVSHYAGLIPAGPGKSHQNLRDISLVNSIPGFTVIEPCNALETKFALDWAVNTAPGNCLLRLAISPSPERIALPEDYEFSFGRGSVLRGGKDAVIFGYGPVMLHEALLANEILAAEGFSLKVVNIPWLNSVDQGWLEEAVGNCGSLFVLDNHFACGGLADFLLTRIASSERLRNRIFGKFALEEFPQCGTPSEVLRYHRLDGKSLAERILGNT